MLKIKIHKMKNIIIKLKLILLKIRTIKKIFHRPFSHDIKYFRLMITTYPFNKNFFSFKYSANGGKSWKYIYHVKETESGVRWEPFSDKRISYSFSMNISKNFSSYQKILDFEKSERLKFKKLKEKSK